MKYDPKIRTAIFREMVVDVEKYFPLEIFSVADKCLWNRVVQMNITECEENEKNPLNYRFAVAVCSDMERMFGYQCKKDFYKLQ